jgi:8-oxo-dGTP pyrophosphatase MutT (NUDIX family)
MTLEERLRERLGSASDVELLVGDLPELRREASAEAAVLIAVTERPAPGVILTVRPQHMRTHAGQIAFPGGRIDANETPETAALREAHEELALDPRFVRLVGAIDPYRTVTGYLVTPVLGIVPPDLPLAPHDAEVADWFEAPLDYLVDPANHERRSALFQGRMRDYYEIDWNGRRIWGATAAMIVNLSRRLQWT